MLYAVDINDDNESSGEYAEEDNTVLTYTDYKNDPACYPANIIRTVKQV